MATLLVTATYTYGPGGAPVAGKEGSAELVTRQATTSAASLQTLKYRYKTDSAGVMHRLNADGTLGEAGVPIETSDDANVRYLYRWNEPDGTSAELYASGSGTVPLRLLKEEQRNLPTDEEIAAAQLAWLSWQMGAGNLDYRMPGLIFDKRKTPLNIFIGG